MGHACSQDLIEQLPAIRHKSTAMAKNMCREFLEALFSDKDKDKDKEKQKGGGGERHDRPPSPSHEKVTVICVDSTHVDWHDPEIQRRAQSLGFAIQCKNVH